ncbi:MAG: hypothetical protein AB7I34_22005 [Rhizobiaceae bacterium]
MWDFSIGRSLSLVLQTWPFVLFRVFVYTLITIGYLFAIGAGGGVGWGVGHISSDPSGPLSFAFGGGAIGFGVAWLVLYWIREYILYVVKAGHVVVMVHAMDGRPIPGAFDQISYARQVVTERFAEANALFVLDQLIKGVLRTISGIFRGLGALLPIPGLQTLIGFINAVIALALTYADEVVLAYNIRSGVNDPWTTSRHALVLYAQNGKSILKNAFWLAIFIWIIGIVFFVLALSPAAYFVYLMPGQFAGWSFVIAIICTWAFLAAFVEPFAIASLMQAYFKVIEGQAPDPEWDATLAEKSRQFRELKDKAIAAVSGRTASYAAAAGYQEGQGR